MIQEYLITVLLLFHPLPLKTPTHIGFYDFFQTNTVVKRLEGLISSGALFCFMAFRIPLPI